MNSSRKYSNNNSPSKEIDGSKKNTQTTNFENINSTVKSNIQTTDFSNIN